MGRILTVLTAIFLAAILISPAFAQYGSSASYNLQWKSIQSGGNEGDDVTSPSYRLSSSIGQPTPVSDAPISSASYDLYSGHRKIDVDLRYPFSWFTFGVRYVSDTSWVLTWSGVDTTAEDGWGWGIWNYDVQYAVGPGPWTPWLDATTDTFATFGHDDPVVVMPGTAYHFRIRARDLARNEAPWDDQDTIIVNYIVEFCVYTDPGAPMSPANHVKLSYVNQIGDTLVEDLWDGHCAKVWCVPGSNTELERRSTASDAEQRWMVNPAEDTIWTMDGTLTDYMVRYWHQLQPIVHLIGTDASHTVSTWNHNQFGPGHFESGLFGIWQDWTDYGSLLEFSDTTTGVPTRHALPADSTRFHDVVAFFEDSIRYLAASNSIVVQTSFGGDSVRIDGTWHLSPFNTDWFDMSTHEIAVKDTIWISDCERWVFDYWVDAPAAPRVRNVTIVGDSVFTAQFHREFRVDIANPDGFGTPVPAVGSYWHNEGSVITGSISPTAESGHVLTGFIGTGSATSGAGSSFWFELYDCSSIEWEWAPEGEMCTLFVYSEYGHPTPDGEWIVPCGTEIYCSVEESTFVGGTWHYVTGWTGDGVVVPASGTGNSVLVTVTGTGWLVWEWDDATMVPLEIASSPGIYGPPNPYVGVHWLPLGTAVDAFVESNPDGDWFCTGFDATGSVTSASADSVSFILDEPTFIEWQWVFSPAELCTLMVFSPHGSPVPSVGMHIYPAGTEVTAWVSTPAGPYHCTGWSGSGSVPLSGGTNSVTFTIDEFSTLTWQWDGDEVIPFVVENPGGHGSPFPPAGIHYYAYGTEINAWVESPDGMWFCVGYEGWGDLPDDGIDDSVTFTITEPTGIRWLWESDAVWLDVVAPPYSGADPPIGRTYHPTGRVIDATANDTAYTTTEHRHICVGWEGDGTVVPASGSDPFVTFTMIDNGTIEWLYENEFHLTLDHDGLPGGYAPDILEEDGWYSEGDTAYIETDSIVWVGGTPYIFMEWDDGGASAEIGDVNSYDTWVLMDNAYQLVAVFQQGVIVDIVKNPAHETPGWIVVDGDTFHTDHYSAIWVTGSSYTIEVSTEDWAETVRWTFDEWRDAPVEAAERAVAPTTDTTFYADYITDYRWVITKTPEADTLGTLSVDGTVHAGEASVYQEHWWRIGSTHTVITSELDESPTHRYTFDEWSDGSEALLRTFGPIDRADSVSAIYQTQYLVRVEKDPLQPHGRIYIDGVAYPGIAEIEFWPFDGEELEIGVSRSDTIGDSLYRFIMWDDGPADTMRVVTITEPDTFVALYEGISVLLRVHFSQYGALPSDSLYWVVRDSLEYEETATMNERDSIKIFNYSNVPIDLGLRIGNIFNVNDDWSLETAWNPGNTPDVNRFVLRARFDDNSEPPSSWWPTRDFVIRTVYWARNETPTTLGVFGPGGENIPPSPDPNFTEKLWLQFVAPRYSENPGHTRMIELQVIIKPNLE
ncbi:MAG TPA: hypothetical protein ENN07_00070 [candidate division Zixibacteria bacterium]|nr:hypothetical protein [candidate division Zixibacteria bacterium]